MAQQRTGAGISTQQNDLTSVTLWAEAGCYSPCAFELQQHALDL